MRVLGVFLLSLFASGVALAVEVDFGVPEHQRRSLEIDLKYLSGLTFHSDPGTEEAKRILKLQGPLSAGSLKEWLERRVSLVLSESTAIDKILLVAPGRATYPEASVFPAVDRPTEKPASPDGEKPSGEPVLVMSNIGTALYLVGKKNQVLLGIRKTDGDLHPLTSPRNGVIQIGRGLFHEKLRVNPESQDLPANSVSRISTLFHESRHSDGHGSTLGFLHAICPKGHPYAGHAACDKNLNGPYTIGAQVLSVLIATCSDCSSKEKTILKLIEADSRSRVLKTYTGENGKEVVARDWSDRHEEVLSFIPKREL